MCEISTNKQYNELRTKLFEIFPGYTNHADVVQENTLTGEIVE